MTANQTRRACLRAATGAVAFAIAAGTAPAIAAVGDQVHQVTVPVSGVDTYCSVGLGFDGTYLYYDRCGDTNIYKIDAITGDLVDTFDTGLDLYPNALAYDVERNGLWIGPQGCVNAAGGEFPDYMPIYLWDFDDNSVTEQFQIPGSLVNPATGESFLGFCFDDGLAFNANDPGDATDDEIWFSDDVNHNLGVFRPDGTLIEGFDGTATEASLSTMSGLAIGGSNVYLANDGGGDVFRANRFTSPLVLVDQFTNGDERQEDMECDPVTFNTEKDGFKEVMWVRTTPQGGAFADVITAYEIEPNTCGLGGEQPECGNGVLEDGEECDDGPLNSDSAACSARCQLTTCGDAIVQMPNGQGFDEQCDDGNNDAGDGCSPRCQIEGEVCGCQDLDQDGWVTYYGPCPEDGNKHNRWLDECESFNDCDDTDSTIHPFATEIPNDGIDQNCNGI
ncbi:MAG: hypothetical protein KC466_18175, partial [Myxococcales bacterium]|nr:hypothetical protein [Myxococcales bacterium]